MFFLNFNEPSSSRAETRTRVAHAKTRIELVKLHAHIFDFKFELQFLTNRFDRSSYLVELKLTHEQSGSF